MLEIFLHFIMIGTPRDPVGAGNIRRETMTAKTETRHCQPLETAVRIMEGRGSNQRFSEKYCLVKKRPREDLLDIDAMLRKSRLEK